MTTIKDICKLANVSKATVSRVLNGSAMVKKETKTRVELAMKTLNYRPNSFAQALATNSSNSVGIVLSDFDGDYFGSIMKQAAKIVEHTNKHLIVTDGHDEQKKEIEAVRFLASRKCDVIVIYSRKITQAAFDKLQQEISVPIVLVGQYFPNSKGFTLAIDQFQVVTEAMQHLLNLGHKKIAYMGPKPNTHTKRTRWQTYQYYLKQNNLPENTIITEGYDHYHGYQSTIENVNLLTKMEALFVASDDLALGCYKAFKENNIHIPKDISIISIDNTKKSAFIDPALTTVQLPINELAEKAVEMAIALSQGKKISKAHFNLTGTLVIRDSVIASAVN